MNARPDHGPVEELAELDAAWECEIARRVDEIRAGQAKLIPLDKVRSNLEATIQRARGGSH
jgi:putative addiction module component (TIGR02574 family)